MKTIAIIIAAGRGKRMKNDYSIPKQYLPLGRSTILRETLLSFKNHPDIDDILCVIHKDDLALYEESIFDFEILNPVFGGENQHESIKNGLMALEEFEPQNVIIHHANRPFASKELISGVLNRLEFCDAVVPAVKEENVVKTSKSGNLIEDSVNREVIWKIQTPEGYKFKTLLSLFKEYEGERFDDPSSLFELAGMPVNIIPGSKKNFKIVNKDDYEIAKALYFSQTKELEYSIRVGNGFDVYQFQDKVTKNSKIEIFGVKLPCDRNLYEKDKTNVGIKTLGNALLGALGEGCIQCRFSKKEQKIDTLFKKISTLIDKKNASINNIDVTFTHETLPIHKYTKKMLKNISAFLHIPLNRINIKANDPGSVDSFKSGDRLLVSIVCCIRVKV